VTHFYRLDEANACLAELEPILLGLRDQRAELIRLRDMVLESDADVRAASETGGAPAGHPERPATPDPDLRLARLRMQGLIDQMQAGVARLDAMDVALRDIETGLIDFPALVSGRQVWLCWRLGEPAIGWWHDLTSGVAGRRAIMDLA
jgi:hypothetical protein